jgi:hypothetical protein
MDKTKDIKMCDFCNKLRFSKDSYNIYRIGFNTNKSNYNIGILEMQNGLNKYLFDNDIKLSTTQVILLRPDILKEYLSLKYNTKTEKVINSFLFEANVCNKCYENYKLEVPNK